MNPPAKISELLGCIDEAICVGGRCHCQKGVLLFLSSRTDSNFLRAKIEAHEALFDEEINQSN
jgi:hypothetical protein